MASLLFGPELQQRRNRSPVIGNQGQPLLGGFQQASGIFFPKQAAEKVFSQLGIPPAAGSRC